MNRMLLELRNHLIFSSKVETKITTINDPEYVKDVKIPRPTAILPSQMCRRLANGCRTKAGTREFGGCQIKGYSADDNIHIII